MFEKIYIGLLYFKYSNICEVQRLTDRCQPYILKIVRELGLKSKSKRFQYSRGRRNKNCLWKGGKSVAWHGYMRVLMPDHPRALSNGYVWEHFLVAEKIIGRPLKYYGKNDPRNENVHHKDSDKRNNHPSNLKIMIDGREHSLYEWKHDEIKFPQSQRSRIETPERYADWHKKNQRR